MSYRPQLQSRLLALPRELRDYIYELAFSNQVVAIDQSPESYRDHGRVLHSSIRRRNAGLVLASRQLHEETLTMYYKHTCFVVYDLGRLLSWLGDLRSDHYAAVKTIKLQLSQGFSKGDLEETIKSVLREAVIEFRQGVFWGFYYSLATWSDVEVRL